MTQVAWHIVPRFSDVAIDEVVADLRTILRGDAADVTYWRTKAPLKQPYLLPGRPSARESDRDAAERMRRGEFGGFGDYGWLRIGVPPPWDVNPLEQRTWDFLRHGLYWIEPLVRVGAGDGDSDSLALAAEVVCDWINVNSVAPGASEYAWNDNAAANRARLLAWFFEIWRTSDVASTSEVRSVLASVYQHGLFLADDTNYRPKSNHGLMMNGALLSLAVTFPELRHASAWLDHGLQRLSRWVADNFSPEGFHLEQSPSYHSLVTRRLGAILGFLQANDVAMPVDVVTATEKAAAVWPWLVRTDGTVPSVGDSTSEAEADWRPVLARQLGSPCQPPANSSRPNPRSDDAGLLVSSDAGYAIFRGGPPDASFTGSDLHLLFKCNSFRSTHCHRDALSFVLYGRGRDWLIDPGMLNMEEQSAERRYMRSARAHNVAMVDDRDFDFHPCRLVDVRRDAEGDTVVASHALPGIEHIRAVRYSPPWTVTVEDRLVVLDGMRHELAQLFHLPPDVRIDHCGPRRAVLSSGTGSLLLIEQRGPVMWDVAVGRREPELQGWYSRRHNELEPAPVLIARAPVDRDATFLTTLTLTD